MSQPKNKININCPIGKTGYGITSLNIVKNLNMLNLDISLFPIGSNMELNDENEKQLFESLIKNNSHFDRNAPCLKIWHQYDLAYRVGSGHYYSFPFFEIDKLNPREIHQINSCDTIFTASEWSKSILLNNGVNIPISVTPLAVDTQIFSPPPKIKINNGNYIFCHIGKWEKRKSQDFLLQAFENAFDINDKVELWLLPFNPFLKPEEEKEWLQLVENNKLKNKIKIFGRLPTQYHLCELIFYTDCGIFLSRAEGWNNEILEFMALNKPVIATNYSAHTEYLNKDNSFLIDVDELELANDGKWFHGEGNWAKLGDKQMEQTVYSMRKVYTDNIQTNSTGLDTAHKYSWNNTANLINKTLISNNSYHYHANTTKKKRRK